MRALAVTVVVAGLVAAAAAAPASAVGPEGDSVVQNGGLFVGYDVINTAGEGQTITKGIKRGKVKSFVWMVANWGTTGSITFQGSGSSQCVRVRYFNLAGDDVTAIVESGSPLNIPAIGVGFPVQVEIKAKGCASPGSSKTINLDASPGRDASRFDGARARVNVK